ncbi:MAG: Ig-like domain-containing protein [Candidatus Sulfotelmatobacter sp.]
MLTTKHKLRLAASFAVLLLAGLGVACTGFFVNPTISSLAVGPASPVIETGNTSNTVQMTVFGTNSDGSTDSSPSVSWSITPTTIATISSTGLVTSVSVGSATVTAAANQNPSITGTQTLTVTVGCIQSIVLNPTSGSVTTNLPTLPIDAMATTCNGTTDVTDVATWTSSNTSLATVSAGEVTIVSGITTGGTVQVTASIGNITSLAATITVSP